MGRRARPDLGVVLLVSLGVMLVLSVLAVSFVRLASQERHASNNYVHLVRAKFAARSGLRMAEGELLTYYRTAVVDTLDTGVAKWVYGESSPATPLELAKSPSLVKGTTTVEGSTVGYSGLAFSPTYDKDWLPPSYDEKVGIQYVLRISDLNGRINLNDPNPKLATMLDNLGIGIMDYDKVPDPVASRGSTIVSTRDTKFGGKFKMVEDLLQAGFSKTDVETLSNYVTVDSWRDTSVITPVAQTSGTSETYVYDFPKFPDGTIAGRSPININTAPRAVLYAMLKGIAARGFLYGSTGAGGGGGGGAGGGGGGGGSGDYWTFASRSAVTDAQAKSLVAVIDVRRTSTPIKSHYDLASVIMGSTYPGLLSMLMANLNPNTRFTKFHQDLTFFNHGQGLTKSDMLDKSDLTFWTTEACFISHGYFQIESLGRVIGKTGNVLARHKLAQIVKLFDAVKHSTQRDFESSKIGHTLTKSHPENMSDQGFESSKSSLLDGQITLDDDSRLETGTRWYVNNDDTFFGPDAHRWTLKDFGKSGAVELYENLPVDAKQSPSTRTILGEDRSAGTRTSSYASNLHPDGHFFGIRLGKRLNIYGIYDSSAGKSNLLPTAGTLEFWYKPDLRGQDMTKAAEGLFSWFLLGPKCPVPATKFMPVELYGAVLSSAWLNGGGGDSRVFINGSLSSTARKSMDMGAYPYSDPYFVLTMGPSHRGALKGQVWNHVRFTWSSWVTWRVYVNGVLVSSANASFIRKPGYTYWNVDVALDFLEFGALYVKNPWGGMWDYRSSGTADKLRTNSSALAGGVVPYRYRVTTGGSKFEGTFKWSSSSSGKYEALSVRYTSYPGFNASGAKSYTGLEATVDATTYSPESYTASTATPGTPGVALGSSFDPLTGVTYRLKFYDGGQAPFTAAPYVDDVTLLYRTSAGTQVLRRWVVE